jgi:hypothetical protein
MEHCFRTEFEVTVPEFLENGVIGNCALSEPQKVLG